MGPLVPRARGIYLVWNICCRVPLRVQYSNGREKNWVPSPQPGNYNNITVNAPPIGNESEHSPLRPSSSVLTVSVSARKNVGESCRNTVQNVWPMLAKAVSVIKTKTMGDRYHTEDCMGLKVRCRAQVGRGTKMRKGHMESQGSEQSMVGNKG